MRHLFAAFALFALGLLGLIAATYVGTHPDAGRLVRVVVVGAFPLLSAAALVHSVDLLTMRRARR